ncbi:MAG: type II toxin-antitoxin system RelE/ParE family toxin [Sandaracinaceae bacterium]|nr:type II toxin-antitoxin system RelE/ParE family toxin [Sandaracinaceae bacterium]
MSRRYVLTPEAREDLREIGRYIARDSPSAATRVLRDLRDAMERLAETPRIGHAKPDVTARPVLFWCVYRYYIVYDPGPRPLRVLRALHGYRNLARLLTP